MATGIFQIETENLQVFYRDSAETLRRPVRDSPEIAERERRKHRESHSKVISEIDVACKHFVDRLGILDTESFKLLGSVAGII